MPYASFIHVGRFALSSSKGVVIGVLYPNDYFFLASYTPCISRPFGEGARCATGGVERTASALPGDGMRGCARTVSRPHGAVPDRGKGPGHELFVHG